MSWDGPLDHHERALESFYEQFHFAGECVFVSADTFEDLDRG